MSTRQPLAKERLTTSPDARSTPRKAARAGLTADTYSCLVDRALSRMQSPCRGYFGMGSKIAAFSANDASPSLPLMRYLIFNCLGVFGAGSPPKLPL